MDAPIYERFDTNQGFQAAVDRLLEQPGRELRVFDPDGAALRLNDPARIERLERFLLASRTRRLYLVVHNTDHLTRQCPRLMTLLRRFSHAMQINRTHEEIREVQDAFLLLDAVHYVRRPVAAIVPRRDGTGRRERGPGAARPLRRDLGRFLPRGFEHYGRPLETSSRASAKPSSWVARPIQSSSHPIARASAARASSGRLFCCESARR